MANGLNCEHDEGSSFRTVMVVKPGTVVEFICLPFR